MSGAVHERLTTVLRGEHEAILRAVGLLERLAARITRGHEEGETVLRERRSIAVAVDRRLEPA